MVIPKLHRAIPAVHRIQRQKGAAGKSELPDRFFLTRHMHPKFQQRVLWPLVLGRELGRAHQAGIGQILHNFNAKPLIAEGHLAAQVGPHRHASHSPLVMHRKDARRVGFSAWRLQKVLNHRY